MESARPERLPRYYPVLGRLDGKADITFRGDYAVRADSGSLIVIPVETGIHSSTSATAGRWIPAFAGMTIQRRAA